MGILNVTPDSFSDGGRFVDVSAAVEQGLRLAADGADILDIGGESTRPYADSVDAKTELDRVLGVIAALRPQLPIPISIDTSKAAVAREALAAGAEIINDVTGLEGDPAMLELARAERPGICVMHMQGTPRDMQDNPTYVNVVEDVLAYLRSRRDHLLSAGIEPARIALDPGIGFGKTHEHNLSLLANCHRFHELGCPVLVGHSRKGFIANVLGDKTADPTAGTIGVALSLASQGIQILRVHDVLPVRQALLLYEASGGLKGHELPRDVA
ncbi:MAG TPA: dihydropteroate synthase [Pirellulales bacterium]|nr:dihydropteroate synthase [Pirellulales bacterium]